MREIRTAIRITIITAVMAVALPSGQVGGSESPADNRVEELQFELVDGTVITGRIDVKAIPFRMQNGSIVKIPVADLAELSVGLMDRPVFVQRVETLIAALDSDKTREDAVVKLIALGPAIKPIVSEHITSGVPARRLAVERILKAYLRWYLSHPNSPRRLTRPLDLQSKVHAGENRFVGMLAVDEFRIAGTYGSIIAKREAIHQIRQAPRIAPCMTRWDLDLRDGTHLRGIPTGPPLRVKTRYGLLVLPLALVRKAYIAADGISVRIECAGSDRIAGTIGAKTTISLKTDKGAVDIPTGKIAIALCGPLTIRGHDHSVKSIAFSPDGKSLLSGSWDRSAKLWDTTNGKELLTVSPSKSPVVCVAFAPDGKRFASVTQNNTITLWETASGKKQFAIKRTADWTYLVVVFSPDGKQLALKGEGGAVELWDAALGTELLSLRGYAAAARSAVFSPDGKALVAGSWNKIIFCDTTTGKTILTLKGHSKNVTSIAFSPNGKHLVSGGDDGVIKLWDIAGGTELFTRKMGYGAVLAVAFSPDGKHLASGGEDNTIRIWHAVTGTELFTLNGHSNKVNSLTFSPDGKRLASGSRDKTIKIWDARDWTRAAK